MENETIKCEVALDRIFYPKHATHVESGTYTIFSAMVIKTIEGKELKKIKLKGNVPKLVYGATFRVYATLSERNPQYGDTYEITYMSKKLDISSKDKQKEFLSNILSERQVENLFDMYDDVLKLLDERDVEALCKVKGIKTQTALKIIDTYEDSKDYSAIYLELGKLGLTNNMIKKLMEFYRSPDTVIDKVRNNPYELVNINGVGFKKADEIAQKVGIDKYDIRRIGGYITHVLIEQGESGRSYLMYQELMKAIYDTLGFIPEDIMKSVATTMIKQGNIIVDMNGERIALKRYYNLEKRISEELMRLMKGEREPNKPDDIYTKYIPKEFNFDDADEKIKSVEKEQGFEFTDEQRQGILLIKNTNVLALTGGGGVGKTSTANGMVNLFDNANVMATALSGKASVRITEATGLQASTIHRLLGWQADGTFLHNRNYPLECDLIVIDEATMINGTLFLQLLQAIPSGAKVIIMGDVQQLTPIGNCQVFADILNSNIVTSVKLTKPHRQALRSGIIPTSMSIASQQQIFKNKFTGKTILGELQDMVLDIHNKDCELDNLVLEYFKEELESLGNIMDVQVCVPMRLRGSLSCYNLNTKIQQYYNPIENYNGNKIEIVLDAKDKDDIKKYTIIEGDKVINVVNNYRAVTLEGVNCPIFNGNIGIVNVIYEDGSCEVDFEGIGTVLLSSKDSKNLELAYTLTVFKLQGSASSSVIVPIDGSSYIMNNSELLYTGVTRAKKKCILIGDNSVIRKTINTKAVNTKQTYLKEMLLDGLNDTIEK